jgi:hypothetical protein
VGQLIEMMNEVVAWSGALKVLRQTTGTAGDRQEWPAA